jgi:hypothetical protein
MASKQIIVWVGAALALAGCQQEIVKAGVPPPSNSATDVARRKTDTAPTMKTTRGGLDLPKTLPKGPY